jgi:hypothetical protein
MATQEKLSSSRSRESVMADPEVHFHDISMAYGKWLHEAVLNWTARTSGTSTSEEDRSEEIRVQQAKDQEALDGFRAALDSYEQFHLQPVYELLHDKEDVA